MLALSELSPGRVVTNKDHKTVITWHEKRNGGCKTERDYKSHHPAFEVNQFRPPTAQEMQFADHIVSTLRTQAAPFFLDANAITEVTYNPRVFDSSWAAALPLPIGADRPSDMEVTILDNGHHHMSTSDPSVIYDALTGGRTLEYVNADMWGGLLGAVSEKLGEHVPGRQIICSVYESLAGAESVGMHTDGQPGIALQILGEKEWQRGDGRRFTTRPGDGLFIPKDAKHSVSTPRKSVHLLISAVDPVPDEYFVRID